MATTKINLLLAMLCILMAIFIPANGRVKDKRLHRNRDDQDKVVRGAIGMSI